MFSAFFSILTDIALVLFILHDLQLISKKFTTADADILFNARLLQTVSKRLTFEQYLELLPILASKCYPATDKTPEEAISKVASRMIRGSLAKTVGEVTADTDTPPTLSSHEGLFDRLNAQKIGLLQNNRRFSISDLPKLEIVDDDSEDVRPSASMPLLLSLLFFH
jgi:hypothetical protein